MIKRLSPFLLFTIAATVWSASRDSQWKKVDDAISKGLPKTAITELEPIISDALKEKAYGEAAKAIARRIVLEGNIQGNKPEEKITRMEGEIAKAPKELVPMLDTILANWYWHYFQNNRWRFMQRTATAQSPGKDFTTWDLPRLFAEIDRQFGNALGASDALKKTPVTAYDELLEKGTMSDAYRPTLYDFVAQEALSFYTSGEQAAAKPQDAFEVAATSPIFDPAEKFIGWKIQTDDTNSPVYKALRLYQDLLVFHVKDGDSSAFADADLARVLYGQNIAYGEEKNARSKAALDAISKRWPDHEVSASAFYHLARTVQQEGDVVQARATAQRGASAFPNSPGGKQCRNLITEIESKSASITTERVWNAPLPQIQVTYRNVDAAYFRVVASDWNTFLEKRHTRPEYLNEAERRGLLAKTPTFAWSAKLPATPDFKERTEGLPAPDNLKPGFYFLIASHDPSFTDRDNQVTFTDIWVSDLALVIRQRYGNVEGFVLDASSGEPLKEAEVMAWYLDNNGNRISKPKVATDENGFFSFPATEQRGYLLRARHHSQELGSQSEFYSYLPQNPMPYSQTIFFTDRSIYRPGQTIQYKGICLQVNQEIDDYELLPSQNVSVIFNDPNGKEIAHQEHRCNDYGSFSGSFTAPRDRLMGQMQLYVSGGPNGSTPVRVEEYKRPKFQVTLDTPKMAAKLNEKVSVPGKAMAYTGAAIDGAQVKYRVLREVRYPYWWSWYYGWRSPQRQGSQEISHGAVKTETDGSFRIEFLAKPDVSVSEKEEPTFSYHIYSDVTDSAGETRSDERTVNVGYTALQASVSAHEWQTQDKPVELRLRTATLDGEGQTAEGALKIYRLKEPPQVERPSLSGGYYPYAYGRGAKRAGPKQSEGSDPNQWELGQVVAEKGITTDAKGDLKLPFKLGVGAYRVVLETQDRFGKKVTAPFTFKVLDPADSKLGIKVPRLLESPDWLVQPGEEFMALWGTGYDTGRAFVEIEHRNKFIQRYWTKSANTQAQIKQAVTEAMRGGFTLHVTQVRENRAYLDSRKVDVPWSNKDLELKWDHFISKLEPAQKETWTLTVTGLSAEKSAAEMVAALYDESLDAFTPHNWMQRFSIFRQDYTTASSAFENSLKSFQYLHGSWDRSMESIDIRYRSFPYDLVANFWGYQFARTRNYAFKMGAAMEMPPPAPSASAATLALADKDENRMRGEAVAGKAGEPSAPEPKGPNLSSVTARKNLNETAFFFPQLISDNSGQVKLQFTMPEALTQWKFLGFAHDKQLRSGFLQGETITAKDLMVQPNPPRFVREGDVLEFTVKVSNQSTVRQLGKVRLTFNEAARDQSADKLLGNLKPEFDFMVPAKESRSYSWRIKIPDGAPFLTYKAVAAGGSVSDGEEGFLPVLSRRIFVTESLPLPIRGPATKKFEFTKLLKSGKSDTLKSQGLTVQMVSNPSWYAVMALPYLMEYPYECAEQIFNRFYANSLARSIASSDPKIHRIFELWRNTPALDSPLEKNQDLKAVMLEETPWYRQAQDESKARKNVGVLFDDNRLNSEMSSALQKLNQMQLADGSWPWFPGGKGNDYITLYITTGFGRLRHLNVDVPVDSALRSLNRLDGWIDEMYRDILKHSDPKLNHLNETIALYLYGRSFFLKDRPIGQNHREAVDYFLGQAREYWLKLANRQSQGHLALALQRFGDKTTPQGIMKSIKERSVSNEEMGMFWRDLEFSWWWYRAPIETQALMIEAFDEVMNDATAVEDCKVWLLKQKQTQDWKTTKATADAVYALLLRGAKNLTSDALVSVSLGGQEIKPQKVEAGTGFYEQKFAALQVKPNMGEITVRKVDQGVAWGSVHWQYLDDMTKVTPHEGTPLKLHKALYTKKVTNKGPVLEPVKGPLNVGDELVVRIELRTDRDMEYVHLKDQRGSGLEPVNVISRYKYQDGLGYYESTRDTASHFFIDYLPKGVYVFEYSTRVVHKGEYQTGMAEIQCMYAPEFNSHSESFLLAVK